jgi:6-phosphogluconolactonase/glucosamine-6-phosphate isomerase/deaminase
MYYDLYTQKKNESYVEHFYADSSPFIASLREEFVQTLNSKLFDKITNALDFIRRYFKNIISRKLGRELKVPRKISIITGKIPVETINGLSGIKMLKPLAAVPTDNRQIIFCDENLKDLGDDELTFWVLPHELLHLNSIENEEFIERFLVSLNEELGFKEVSSKIRQKSGYLN